jgi:hypothetical protein
MGRVEVGGGFMEEDAEGTNVCGADIPSTDDFFHASVYLKGLLSALDLFSVSVFFTTTCRRLPRATLFASSLSPPLLLFTAPFLFQSSSCAPFHPLLYPLFPIHHCRNRRAS